jgi:hypothetical protein
LYLNHLIYVYISIYHGTKQIQSTPIYGRYICEKEMKPSPPFEIAVDVGILK